MPRGNDHKFWCGSIRHPARKGSLFVLDAKGLCPGLQHCMGLESFPYSRNKGFSASCHEKSPEHLISAWVSIPFQNLSSFFRISVGGKHPVKRNSCPRLGFAGQRLSLAGVSPGGFPDKSGKTGSRYGFPAAALQTDFRRLAASNRDKPFAPRTVCPVRSAVVRRVCRTFPLFGRSPAKRFGRRLYGVAAP